MRAHLLGVVLVLAAGATPMAAAADTVCVPAGLAFACVSDASASQGSCATQGYAYGYDSAFVFALLVYAFVHAGHSCYADPSLTQESTSVSADAFTPVAAVQVQWADVRQSAGGSTHEACTVQVVVGTPAGWRTVAEPCPAGAAPPNPGWGSLLPLP